MYRKRSLSLASNANGRFKKAARCELFTSDCVPVFSGKHARNFSRSTTARSKIMASTKKPAVRQASRQSRWGQVAEGGEEEEQRMLHPPPAPKRACKHAGCSRFCTMIESSVLPCTSQHRWYAAGASTSGRPGRVVAVEAATRQQGEEGRRGQWGVRERRGGEAICTAARRVGRPLTPGGATCRVLPTCSALAQTPVSSVRSLLAGHPTASTSNLAQLSNPTQGASTGGGGVPPGGAGSSSSSRRQQQRAPGNAKKDKSRSRDKKAAREAKRNA